ncbi:Glycerol-3-phosphate dehydrogenase [NAD(+)] 2, chloroplastic [Linum grandiflorum]
MEHYASKAQSLEKPIFSRTDADHCDYIRALLYFFFFFFFFSHQLRRIQSPMTAVQMQLQRLESPSPFPNSTFNNNNNNNKTTLKKHSPPHSLSRYSFKQRSLLLLPPLSCSEEETPSLEYDSTADNPSLDLDRFMDRRKVVRLAWEKLLRWSRSWRSKNNPDVLRRTKKVVVLGGGSFGTSMAAHVASRKSDLEVHMLLRDELLCQSINLHHCNRKYFPHHKLPVNVIATTDPKTAMLGADYCFHAVPVQFSSLFLESIADSVDPGLPFISLSKGLELNTLRTMSQIIPKALKNPRQPFVALSGPSFALELMNKLPTVCGSLYSNGCGFKG